MPEAVMNVPVSEQQLLTLAFYLWEEAGCPPDRAADYWEEARKTLRVASADIDE
jgi:Protein of unknown function (DUF2934)